MARQAARQAARQVARQAARQVARQAAVRRLAKHKARLVLIRKQRKLNQYFVFAKTKLNGNAATITANVLPVMNISNTDGYMVEFRIGGIVLAAWQAQ